MTNGARAAIRLAAGICGVCLALSSCSEETSGAGPTATRNTTTSPQATDKRTERDQPKTAAACEGPLSGDVGRVVVNPDTPAPRCLVVRPEQRLKVRNDTHLYGHRGSRVAVTFGSLQARTLDTGEALTFRRPQARSSATASTTSTWN